MTIDELDAQLIADIARDVTAADLQYVDCACDHAAIRHGAWSPENFRSWRKAAARWVFHCVHHNMGRTRYEGLQFWAVHHRGRHVLNVRNEFGLEALGGPPHGPGVTPSPYTL